MARKWRGTISFPMLKAVYRWSRRFTLLVSLLAILYLVGRFRVMRIPDHYNVLMEFPPAHYVLLDRMYFLSRSIRAGDAVLYHVPGEGLLMGKVVAVPGNKVEEKEGALLVDGKPTDLPYPPRLPRQAVAGDNQYLIYNENRRSSFRDSFYWGWIEDVRARVLLLLVGSDSSILPRSTR